MEEFKYKNYMIDKVIWQYKDNEPIEAEIDEFRKTQIVLLLLGMDGGIE